MAGSEKATTTMMWMKQLSTTTINSVSNKMKAFMSGSPLKRHVAMAIAVWLVLNLVAYFSLQGKIETAEKTFASRGVDLALGRSLSIRLRMLDRVLKRKWGSIWA